MKIGEFEFLRRILPTLPQQRGVVVGPGHDCARVRVNGKDWLLTSDTLVEGTHFLREWLTPYNLGWRAFAVNASDIAAMGGKPRFALVSLTVPKSYSEVELKRVERGIASAAGEAGVSVVGGNISRGREFSVTLTLVGEAPARVVTRAGAQVGDRIFVSGTLGDAALAVERLREKQPVAPALYRRWVRPTPRLELGRRLAVQGLVTAMIDVSDGLLQDLRHICAASGVGAVVNGPMVPRSSSYNHCSGGKLDRALGGGEDYELLFTVPLRKTELVMKVALELSLRVTCIGEVQPGGRIAVLDSRGGLLEVKERGFDHFRQ